MIHTEDDTFDALRRIPQSQVREILDEYAVWFESWREIYYVGEAYNNRAKKWNKLKQLVGMNICYKDLSNPFLEKDMEDRLKGTGWTLESYAIEVDKPILERRATVHNIKVKRRTYIVCATLAMLLLGMFTALVVGLPWLDGILTGLCLTNITTVTYHWIAEKHWPYPSYHYRYE
jgi:hypothetical protein